MTSWRDTAPRAVQDDLDGLLDAVLPVAEQALGQRGEMLPFGAVVDADGRVTMLAADPGLGDRPLPAAVLEAVHAAALSDADARRAVAVVADVWTLKGDALRVELEHREGPALVVLRPYRRARFTRRPTYAELTTGPGEHRVWVREADDAATDDS